MGRGPMELGGGRRRRVRGSRRRGCAGLWRGEADASVPGRCVSPGLTDQSQRRGRRVGQARRGRPRGCGRSGRGGRGLAEAAGGAARGLVAGPGSASGPPRLSPAPQHLRRLRRRWAGPAPGGGGQRAGSPQGRVCAPCKAPPAASRGTQRALELVSVVTSL